MLEAVEERSDNTIEASESTNHHFKDQSSESFYVKPIKDSKIQIQLVWENIECTVTAKKTQEKILKGVSGYSNSGEVLAIMGSSGSGKTTLVSILAGQNNRVLNGHISGEITANGKNIRETSYQLHCAYVTQEDILLATLTARESLMFSSQLRCSGALEDHKNRVEKILEDLKLDMIGDDLIGSVFNKGVSGGERKRICIGIELITEPSILILDEPTSGLDSYTADIVFRLLQDQARKGRNIITTVHQPSYAIFEKISRLILMSEGNIIYQGPAHRSRKFFADLDYKCPRNVLPTDYYMKILHVVNRHDQTEVEKNNLERFLIAYKSLNVIEDKPKPDFPSYDTDLSDKPYVASFLSRFSILLSRSSKNARRNVFFSRVKIAQAIGVALLLTLIFNNLGKDYAAIQNRNGVLYMLALTAFTLGSANASLSFPIERPLIMKEFSQGLYDSYSYFIAKTITEIPNLCVAIMLESLIVYWGVGLNVSSASKFFIFYAILLSFNMCGNAFGYFTGALFSSSSGAMAAGPLLTLPFSLYGGQLASINSLASTFSWIQYISPYRYGFEALCINEYTDLDLYCLTCKPETDPSCIPCDPLGTLGFSNPLSFAIIATILIGITVWLITSLLLHRLSIKARH